MTTDTANWTPEMLAVRQLAVAQGMCEHTHHQLHKRNTVVIRTWPNGRGKEPWLQVVHFEYWDRIKTRFTRLNRSRSTEFEVWDGRELF
jgi:hypothetical protein